MSRHQKQITQSFSGGEVSEQMFSRHSDAKVQSGAALLRNMIVEPSGAVSKRPGSRLIREVKSSALDAHVRLISFNYSIDQNLMIEAGRAFVTGREIGYFRFHTENGTLLYDKPANYVAPHPISTVTGNSTGSSAVSLTKAAAGWIVNQFAGWALIAGGSYAVAVSNTATAITVASWVGGTPAAISAFAIIPMKTGTNQIDAGAAHGLETGDPFVLTLDATSTLTITFDASTNYVLLGQSQRIIDHGTTLIFQNTGGALPFGINERQIYYAYLPDATGFRISKVPFGTPIDLTDVGTGTNRVAAMPTLVGVVSYLPTKVYYAIKDSTTLLRIAESKADALLGNALPIYASGIGDWRVHYAYEPRDQVYTAGSYVCMRRPWGDASLNTMEALFHADHSVSATNYWCQLPGTAGSVTATALTDVFDWGSPHGFEEAMPVIFQGSPVPTGITAGEVYYLRSVATNTFKVSESPYGEIVDLVTAGATVTAFVGGYYEVPHYYTDEELRNLTTAQSNDVLTLASGYRPAAELRRRSASKWELRDITFEARVLPPNNLTYAIYRGEGMHVTVAAIAALAQLDTDTPHGFAKNEPVFVQGLSAQGIADGSYVVHDSTVAASSAVFLRGVQAGGPVASTASGGSGSVHSSSPLASIDNTYVISSVDSNGQESGPSNEVTAANNLFVAGARNILSWSSVQGAERYRIYKNESGIYGLIGESTSPTFIDDNIGPDLTVAPPIPDPSLYQRRSVAFDLTSNVVVLSSTLTNGSPVLFETNDVLPTGLVEGTTYFVINAGPNGFQVAADRFSNVAIDFTGSPSGSFWCISGAFPSSVGYFNQRRVFAGSLSLPQDVWMTASGTEDDLSYSIPTVDSDRIYFRMSARENNAIKHVVPLTNLLLLGASAEFRVTPVNDDVITPTSVDIRPQSFIGSASSQPSIVNNIVIFVAARGGHVREMGFNSDISGYLTGDLSLRASHLFRGSSIIQQSYQKAPSPVVWFASSSGKMLGLTYIPEEQVGAWHQHRTGASDTVTAVSVISEGIEDHPWIVARRTSVAKPVTAMIAGARYKIVSVGTTDFTTLGATSNTVGEEFVASGAGTGTGTASRIRRMVERLENQDEQNIEDKFRVDCGSIYDGTAATQMIASHLAGETVAYLADGIEGTALVGENGVFTLPRAASKVIYGLPITVELHTAPLTMQVDAFGSGKTKNINAVWLRVFESGSFQVGPTLASMTTVTAPTGTLLSGLVRVTVPPSWNDEGQLYIRQVGALPLTIVGVTIEVASGG